MRRAERSPLSKRKKILAAVAAFAVSSTVLFGGSLAVLTDASTTEEQTLVAGTVDIDVEDADANPNFNVPIHPMAAGDSFARYVNVRNKGNLATEPLRVSQENGGGKIITGDFGVLVTAQICDQAWVNGECGGTLYEDALPMLQLNGWNTPLLLNTPRMEPGEVHYYKFITSLPAGAPNDYQDEASWVKYTFNGIQRGSTADTDGTTIPTDPDLPPVEPVVLTAKLGPNGDRVELGWEFVESAESYRLERTTTPDDPKSWVIVSLGTGNTVIDRSVSPDTKYYYRAFSLGNNLRTQEESNTVEVHTWMEDAPVELKLRGSGSNLTPTSAALGWNTLIGARSTRLLYSTAPELADAQEVELAAAAEEHEVKDLTPATDYYFQVVQSGEGRTVKSNVFATKTLLSKPVLTLDSRTDRSLTLSFSGEPGATYVLRHSNETIYEGSGPFTHENLEAGRAYSYTLTASKNGRTASVSSNFYTTVAADGTGISLPANALSVDNLNSTTVWFEWGTVRGATGYRIESAADESFTEDKQVNYEGAATAFRMDGLAPYTTRYYRLVAVNPAADSELSTPSKRVTTLPVAPLTEVAATAEADTVQVKWADLNIAGATYILEQSATRTGSYRTVGAYSTTEALVSDLAPGRYWFRITVDTPLAEAVSGEPTSIDLTGLGTPQIVQVQPEVSGNKSLLRVTYKLVEGASTYQVFYRKAGATEWFDSANGSAISSTEGQARLELWSSEQVEVMVTARTNSGETTSSTIASALTLPAVTGSNAQLSYIEATDKFRATMGATLPTSGSYRLELATAADYSDAQVIYSGTAASYEFSPPSREPARYYVRVTIVDRYGQEATTSNLQASLTNPPAAPTGVLVTPVTDTTFTVTWDPVAYAAGYRVWENDGPSSILCEGEATSCTVTVAAGYLSMPFSIRAYRLSETPTGGEQQAMSAPAYFEAQGKVDAPSLAVGYSETSINLSWTATANTATYKLERSTTASMDSPVTVYEGLGTSYADSEPKLGETFYYRLTAMGANGTTNASPSVEAALKATVPVLSVVKPTVGGMDLSWTSIAGATNYKVTYSTSSTFATTPVTTAAIAANSTSLTGLTPATRYYFKVSAFNDAGEQVSSESNVVTEVTEREPINLRLDYTDWATGRFQFSIGTGTASTVLEESLDNGETWTAVATQQQHVSAGRYLTVTGRDPSRTYTYRSYVLADGGSAKVGYSAPQEFAIQPDMASVSFVNQTDGFSSVDVTWGSLPLGAAGMEVYRRVSTDSPAFSSFTKVSGLETGSFFRDTTVEQGKTYFYIVRSVSATGAYRETSQYDGQTNVKYIKPVLSAPVVVDGTHVTLTWQNASSCNNLYVQRATTETGPFTNLFVASQGETSYTDATALSGEDYYYRIYTGCGDSAYASTSQVRAASTPLEPVKFTDFTSVTTTGFRANWDRTAADGYVVQYSTDPAFTTAITVAPSYSAANTGYTFSGMEAATAYYVRVISYNSTKSVESISGRVTTMLVDKPVVTAGAAPLAKTATTSSVKATWPAVPLADSYRVELKKSSISLGTTEVTGTTYESTKTLDANSTYSVTVTALRNNGAVSAPTTVNVSSAPVELAAPTIATPNYLMQATYKAPGTVVSSVRLGVFATADTDSLTKAWANLNVSGSSTSSIAQLHVPGSTHYFRFFGTYGGEVVPVSDPVAYTTPVMARNLTALNVGSPTAPQISLDWDPVPGAVSYTVRRSGTVSLTSGGSPYANASSTTVYSGPADQYVDTTAVIANNLAQAYSVEATYADGSKTFLAPITVTDTARLILPTPTYEMVGSSVKLKWTPVEGATDYRVRCSVGNVNLQNSTVDAYSLYRSPAVTTTTTDAIVSAALPSTQAFSHCTVEARTGTTRIAMSATVMVIPPSLPVS